MRVCVELHTGATAFILHRIFSPDLLIGDKGWQGRVVLSNARPTRTRRVGTTELLAGYREISTPLFGVILISLCRIFLIGAGI